MGSLEAKPPMSAEHFENLRNELLRASSKVSCAQALELADLLHAVIRMRKRHPCLKNPEDLLIAELDLLDPPEPKSFAYCRADRPRLQKVAG
jgi:hypothetical protein